LPARSELREHFFLVCGYGEAGHLICQALDELATGRW
jgi:hypothetical protein